MTVELEEGRGWGEARRAGTVREGLGGVGKGDVQRRGKGKKPT